VGTRSHTPSTDSPALRQHFGRRTKILPRPDAFLPLWPPPPAIRWRRRGPISASSSGGGLTRQRRSAAHARLCKRYWRRTRTKLHPTVLRPSATTFTCLPRNGHKRQWPRHSRRPRRTQVRPNINRTRPNGFLPASAFRPPAPSPRCAAAMVRRTQTRKAWPQPSRTSGSRYSLGNQPMRRSWTVG
jgi:hypothetical protein